MSLLNRNKLNTQEFLAGINSLLAQHSEYESWMSFTKAWYVGTQITFEAAQNPSMPLLESHSTYYPIYHEVQLEFLRHNSLV
jgi:hypothetical protein